MENLPLVAQYAGIAGVALVVVAFVLREAIAAKVFPTLSRRQAFTILFVGLGVLVFLAVFGISAGMWRAADGLQHGAKSIVTAAPTSPPSAETTGGNDVPEHALKITKKPKTRAASSGTNHGSATPNKIPPTTPSTTVSIGSVTSNGQTGGVTAGHIDTVNQGTQHDD